MSLGDKGARPVLRVPAKRGYPIHWRGANLCRYSILTQGSLDSNTCIRLRYGPLKGEKNWIYHIRFLASRRVGQRGFNERAKEFDPPNAKAWDGTGIGSWAQSPDGSVVNSSVALLQGDF